MNNLSNKRLQKFAEPTITATSYSGEFAGQYIAAALLSANTLDKKLVTIMPNVKYKEVIQKVATSGIVQDASCDFVTSGSVTLTEAVITPKELQVNLTLCKQQFVASWQALQLGYSAFDEIPNLQDETIPYLIPFKIDVSKVRVNILFPSFQFILPNGGQFHPPFPPLDQNILQSCMRGMNQFRVLLNEPKGFFPRLNQNGSIPDDMGHPEIWQS